MEDANGTGVVISTAVDAVKSVSQGAVEQTRNVFHLDEISKYLTWANLMKVITSVIAIIFFYIVYKIIVRLVKKNASKKFKAHTVSIINKIISYLFYISIIMYILSLFGIKLSAIWGAAGIAGVAIGFAAQTSVSNLISGLFVIGEKSMRIGDFISIGDMSGTVDTIGLLSIRIHTLDNQSVRIPNSTIINSNLINYSLNSIRRFVFKVSVDYDTDMSKALEAMKKVAPLCPTVLSDPKPVICYTGFGDSGINIEIAVWCKNADLIQTKNDVHIAIKKVCDKEKINIPFNRLDVSVLNNVKAKK